MLVLDGQVLFDEQELSVDVGSFSRAAVERSVPGLEGVLSIDFGGRGRTIKQTGVLRAKSKAQMHSRVAEVSAYMDGGVHVLAAGADVFENVRMDLFKVSGERTSGADVIVDYEIVYTQLQV